MLQQPGATFEPYTPTRRPSSTPQDHGPASPDRHSPAFTRTTRGNTRATLGNLAQPGITSPVAIAPGGDRLRGNPILTRNPTRKA